MGQVYRARDTKLNRYVALKVLPDSVACDPDRLARFTREAQTLASLNHPHIAAIYGLEESGASADSGHTPVRALVMELVEGEDLSERIARGAIAFNEAWAIAGQIANALEAAHEQGIIHRDLKPANIKVRPDGTVKVLDFGLAKALDGSEASEPLRASAATITSPAPTGAGVILGTAAYMSPEQATGAPIDTRADIWSFGVVLYEMLTSRRPFDGETLAATLGAVLSKEPQWDGLPTPARRLITRCLEKDPRRRLRDIGDAALFLEDAPTHAIAEVPGAVRGQRLPWIVSAVLTVMLGLAGWALWKMSVPRSLDLMRFTVAEGIDEGPGSSLAISPDGTRVVFRTRPPGASAATLLATRRLDESRDVILSGTEGAANPFYSPDGRWIAFFKSGKLWKIATTGGTPVAICEALSGRGGDWGDDGTIVTDLSAFSGLWRVSDQGGVPQQLTRPSLERHAWPQFLPDGKGVLYSAGPEGLLENGRIEVVPLDGGEPTIVLNGGYQARYVPTGAKTGHLVYVHAGTVHAVGFDPARRTVIGKPVQILDDIASSGTQARMAFSVSRTGTFSYVSGRVNRTWTLAWFSESGLQPLAIAPGAYYTPRMSPDGNMVAVSVDGDRGQDIFVYDIRRDTLTRVTFTGEGNLWPIWTPDGRHLIFTSRSAKGGQLWWVPIDGTSQPTPLLTSKNSIRQIAISADGRHIGYTEQDPETGSDLWILPFDPTAPDAPRQTPTAVLKTTRNEGVPAFSPDGRWLAYISDELGVWDIWVQPFPSLKGRWQVSRGNATPPFWSRTASEILYQVRDGLVRVPYSIEGERFVPGKSSVRALTLPRSRPAPIGVEMFDLTPDNRLLMAPEIESTTPRDSGRVTFLINFFDELRRRVP